MSHARTTEESLAAGAAVLTFVAGMITYQTLHTVGLIGHVEPTFSTGMVNGIVLAGLLAVSLMFIVEG